MTSLDSILKSRDITLPTKVCVSQSYCFSSGHVWMWELDHKESWAPKNWCFGTVVLEKTLESPLDCKEIQRVHPKGNQSWVFIRTDAKAETPILWPPDVKNWLIGKDPDAGKDWRREEKGTTEDEMVGWHHRPDGQGGLACCDSGGCKELNATEWANWTEQFGINTSLFSSSVSYLYMNTSCIVWVSSGRQGEENMRYVGWETKEPHTIILGNKTQEIKWAAVSSFSSRTQLSKYKFPPSRIMKTILQGT